MFVLKTRVPQRLFKILLDRRDRDVYTNHVNGFSKKVTFWDKWSFCLKDDSSCINQQSLLERSTSCSKIVGKLAILNVQAHGELQLVSGKTTIILLSQMSIHISWKKKKRSNSILGPKFSNKPLLTSASSHSDTATFKKKVQDPRSLLCANWFCNYFCCIPAFLWNIMSFQDPLPLLLLPTFFCGKNCRSLVQSNSTLLFFDETFQFQYCSINAGSIFFTEQP